MSKKSPLQTVKEQFGDKTKLVEAIRQVVGDDLWAGKTAAGEKSLEHVSNAKLLRMHASFTEVKKNFGTRAKLVGAIAELEQRGKDESYHARIGSYPVARLHDMWKSASKRSAAAKAAAKSS